MDTQKAEKTLDKAGLYIAFLSLLCLAGLYAGFRISTARTIERAQKQAGLWRDEPRAAALSMIDKYGPPDRIGAHELVWFARRPWKRVTVHDDPPQNPIEETVGYQLTPQALQAVSSFDHGVRADAASSELTARGDGEGLNRLALNLVHEVAEGSRSAKDASRFYRKTAELSLSGKSSPYMDELLFKPYEPMADVWVRDFKY